MVAGLSDAPPDSVRKGFLRDFVMSGGTIDYAVRGKNTDIVSLVLERIDLKHWTVVNHDGVAVAGCLHTAVSTDCLDIIELLLSDKAKYCQLCHFHCLVLAILMNKGMIFSKILPKALIDIDRSFSENKDTLLHKAVKYNRVKMLRLLVEAGSCVNVKDADGFTPLTMAVAIAGANHCGEGCYDLIISELLSSKSVDLDITVKEGVENSKAKDFLNDNTCAHVRKLVDQAYSRNVYRKKLAKRMSQKSQEKSPVSPSNNTRVNTGTSTDSKDENKICWYCSADPEKVVLFKCKGCRVAWYCGEKCQGEDWPVHGPWCDRKREVRKGKRKTKKEETEKNMSAVFYDLD